jgi:hypothetical protein
MTDSTKTSTTLMAPVADNCLGRTCLKWGEDGELTALDLSLVLERLAQVDQEMSSTAQMTQQPLPCASIG